jgi:hypothetical protein
LKGRQGGFIQPLENIEALRHFVVGAWQSKSPYRKPKSTLQNFLLINETTLPLFLKEGLGRGLPESTIG